MRLQLLQTRKEVLNSLEYHILGTICDTLGFYRCRITIEKEVGQFSASPVRYCHLLATARSRQRRILLGLDLRNESYELYKQNNSINEILLCEPLEDPEALTRKSLRRAIKTATGLTQPRSLLSVYRAELPPGR